MDRQTDGDPIILENADAAPRPEPEIEVLPARFRIRQMHIPGEINPYAPQRHFHMTHMDDGAPAADTAPEPAYPPNEPQLEPQFEQERENP